nr:MAG TPA: hypothetical protein [Caudoviricetes sp.]
MGVVQFLRYSMPFEESLPTMWVHWVVLPEQWPMYA